MPTIIRKLAYEVVPTADEQILEIDRMLKSR